MKSRATGSARPSTIKQLRPKLDKPIIVAIDYLAHTAGIKGRRLVEGSAEIVGNPVTDTRMRSAPRSLLWIPGEQSRQRQVHSIVTITDGL